MVISGRCVFQLPLFLLSPLQLSVPSFTSYLSTYHTYSFNVLSTFLFLHPCPYPISSVFSFLSHTLSLPPAGHRRNHEHRSEWAAWAGAAELSQTRSWCGAGHPGAAADLWRQRWGSHAGQLQWVPQPHPWCHAEVYCQHRATNPPQHQHLQWHYEHLQTCCSTPHGGAAQAPSLEAQAHGYAQVQPGATVSCYIFTGSSGQVLHHVTSGIGISDKTLPTFKELQSVTSVQTS